VTRVDGSRRVDVHPRLSVSTISSRHLTLDQDLALYAELGIPRVGLAMAKLRAYGYANAARRMASEGVAVTGVCGVNPIRLGDEEAWPEGRSDLLDCAEAAAAMGAPTVVVTSGAPGRLTWEQAAKRLSAALAPVLAACEPLGITLGLEHSNALRLDVGFVQTLADAVDLARDMGCGVCMEVNACWMERGLAATLRRSADVLTLVQVSDYVVGTAASPDRAVPGDGDIPLESVLGEVLDAGYDGLFEIELIGPRIEAEGYASAIVRAVERTGRILDRLGA
jgi:sugar phosphate isomerase/epimerase